MFRGVSWQEARGRFFSEIAPFFQGYKSATVSFLGTLQPEDDTVSILKMIVRLQPLSPPAPKEVFRCGTIVAGAIRVTHDIETFLEELLTGTPQETDAGMLQFAPLQVSIHEMTPLDERALNNATRLTTAVIVGRGEVDIPQPTTDWSLRAHTLPYSDINDLAGDYGFGEVGHLKNPVIELEAYAVGVVDPTSTVVGSQANIKVRLTKGLGTEPVSVGIKIHSNGNVTDRVLLKGDSMIWEDAPDNEEIFVGSSQFIVPEDAILHCYLSYGGAPMHSYWVRDERTIPNSSRLLLEAFDEGLEKVTKGIAPVSIRKRDQSVQDNFEYACAAIIWMLGFSAFQLPRKSMSNAPDILARVPPAGDVLLVECTTGPFGVDKRAKLAKRAVEVRASLSRSWHGHVRVLPVMVTSEPREVVEPMLLDMRREGIFGLAYEDLVSLVEKRTLIPVNPESLVVELEAAFVREEAPVSGQN